MAEVGPMPCERVLVGRLLPVFWWMELYLVSLKGSAVSSSVFQGAYGLVWLWAANIQGCAPVLLRIGMGHPAPDLAGFWVGFGLSVEMETFGKALTY